MRKLKTGATRDSDNGKYEYLGFINPLCDYSFAKYMHKFRTMADGTKRESRNWQKGFGLEIPAQSLVRHLEDFKLLHEGFFVYEYRKDKIVERRVYKKKFAIPPPDHKEITFEDSLNAIRFNAEAYKLELLLRE